MDDPKERNLYLKEDVSQASMGSLIEKIHEINESDKKTKLQAKAKGLRYTPKPIKLYIDTYGGSVYSCLGLVSVMKKSKTPVHTIVTGFAASCGMIILMCGAKRYAYEHSSMLCHPISSGTFGDVQTMEEGYKSTNKISNKIDQLILDHTKISRKILNKIRRRKIDRYFYAKKALKWGVIDEII